jgi:glycerol uptake facilitator-like aquaporin
MTATLSRRVVADFIGTGFLVAAVVGSGIMGDGWLVATLRSLFWLTLSRQALHWSF